MPWRLAYVVVFVASFCSLVLELIAGRILAPYIGVSLYTWTSIIGVVLAGISAGNYLGGILADRWPGRKTLGVVLACGSLTSFAVLPLIGIATAIPSADILQSGNGLGGVLAPDRAAVLIVRIVLITGLIFLPPSLILGMVSPLVIKLSLHDVRHTGGLVGRIYAVSTLGSIAGTFATGFLLIQLFGTRWIVLGVGVVLCLLALVSGELWRPGRAAAPLGAAILLTAALIPGRTALARDCVHAGAPLSCLVQSTWDSWKADTESSCLHESSYYCIRVEDETLASGQPVRKLILDHLVHSYTALDNPSFLDYGYLKVYADITDYLAARLPDHALKILYVGGGGYTFPRYVEARYPLARQEVIEIDPEVTATAYDLLGIDAATTHIITYNADARVIVQQLEQTEPEGSYDLVIGDAFNDLSVPYHLTTQEFDSDLRRLLKPDGLYAALVIDRVQGGRFLPAYVRTLSTVWENTEILADSAGWESTQAGTYVVVAGHQPLDISLLSAGSAQGGVARMMPPEQEREWLTASHPPVLTDDYAPVDNLLAPIFADRGF